MSLTPRIDQIDRNYIINGNFDFWQRGTSQAFSAGSTFGSCDRFRPSLVLATGAGTFSRSNNVPDSNSVYSARFAITTAQASMSTTDSLRMVHFIEGNIMKPLIGKDATLAFHFRTNKAGIYSVALQNNGANTTYTTQFTVSSAEASGQLWVQRVINFNLPNVTWNKDANRGLSIVITFADGTIINQAPSLNSWNSGSHTWYTGQVNMVDTIGNFAEISKIMLIEGTYSAPEFSTAGSTYADELQLCQRYYWNKALFRSTFIRYAGTSPFLTIPNPVTMRAIPTASYSSLVTLQVDTGTINAIVDYSGHTVDNIYAQVNTSNTGVSGQVQFTVAADAEL